MGVNESPMIFIRWLVVMKTLHNDEFITNNSRLSNVETALLIMNFITNKKTRPIGKECSHAFVAFVVKSYKGSLKMSLFRQAVPVVFTSTQISHMTVGTGHRNG